MKKYFLFILYLSSHLSLYSKDTCNVGVYIKSLYDFNSSSFEFRGDFWIWVQHKNQKLDPISTLEIANSKNEEFKRTKDFYKNGYIISFQNCKSTINQNWDLVDYPFDRQKLEIIIEDNYNDTEDVVINLDGRYLQDKSTIDLKGWEIEDLKYVQGTSIYKTDFGDFNPTGTNVYPHIKCILFLKRNSTALFFKLFTGVYVAFLVAWLVFFIKPTYVDPRFGLSIGGLFAAVGNKYVVDSNIPENISFTLVDKIHDLTFVFILLTIIFSVISLKLHDLGKLRIQRKFDMISSVTFITVFVIINMISVLGVIK